MLNGVKWLEKLPNKDINNYHVHDYENLARLNNIKENICYEIYSIQNRDNCLDFSTIFLPRYYGLWCRPDSRNDWIGEGNTNQIEGRIIWKARDECCNNIERIGGPNHIVQIDESLICRWRIIPNPTTYHDSVPGAQWMVGVIDQNTGILHVVVDIHGYHGLTIKGVVYW